MTPEFLHCFRSLLTALGDRPGWYAEYARRDPDAARAHVTGHEVPPWDVVRTVLRDLARNAGASDAGPADIGRIHALHAAAVVAEDARPGTGARLYARLAAAERAHEAAAARARDAARAHARQPSTSRAGFLAWTHDDLERAAARRAALQSRLDAVLPATGEPGPGAPGPARRPRGARFAGAYETAAAAPVEGAAPSRDAAPRGARFAGSPVEEAAPESAPAPRGARFAGAATDGGAGRSTPEPAPAPRGARFAGAPKEAVRSGPPAPDPRWTAEARAEAARLLRLRAAGDSGAAYLALSAAAQGPAERLPYVVRALERTGLVADAGTLLWEVAALPPAAVAAAVAALAADRRDEHARTLLHQTAARPAAEVAVVADLLHSAGHTGEAAELLETVARARPADAAADVARARPALTAPLLAAAARVAPPCRRDLAAALLRG
ncbi:hypothetical protein [Streptomyces sp. NRRL F-5123]|uniref:hypothetical protein n=1 Tax=Streptomyces sp. NRRL F-5123 TaxID=1463856 RepID=UPI00069352F6|nr:hypothetical protein [Streptomyces sp. NRRL F-5123]